MAINITDFDKIWASSSPLTPYSFSDANYQEGWNFIGATPPARQMWDFLQKNNDEKLQFLANAMFKGNPLTFTADDGNGNSVSLVGNPNGSITWNGKEIERVNASGTNYMRYESGLQICWGYAVPSSGVCNITFPQAFANTDYTCSAIGRPGSSGAGAGRCVSVQGNTLSTTAMSITITDTNNAAAGTSISWLAIGLWK